MEIFNIQALIAEGKVVDLADLVPSETYLQIGVFQNGNSRSASGNNAYPSYVIPLSELLAPPSAGWNLDGNSNGVERYIGTNNNFAFPIRTNNIERARYAANGDYSFGNNVDNLEFTTSRKSTSNAFYYKNFSSENALLVPGLNSIGFAAMDTISGLTASIVNYHAAQFDAAVMGSQDVIGAIGFEIRAEKANGIIMIRNGASEFSFSPNGTFAFGNIGGDPSAIIDANVVTRGVLVPRVTTVQKNAIAAPATSLLVFDTTVGSFSYYDGAVWQFLDSTVSAEWLLDGNTNGAVKYIGTNDGFDFPIYTNAVEVMRVTAGGAVGIGTSTPGFKLQVEVTATDGIAVTNGVNSIVFTPAGTSAVGAEITTSQIGFEIISSSGLFRFQRSGGAGDALIYGDSNITGITIGDGSGTSVIRVIYGAPNKVNLAVQVGNAGLASGELYLDSAANILANGDLVVGSKV